MKSHISAGRRWLRFNAVGLVGVGVQLAMLQMLVKSGLEYHWATLIAVECAVLNNFAWHGRYTWRDRQARSWRASLRRLFIFHITNGALSLGTSWTLMTLLVNHARLPVIVANLICIAACSVVNFLLAELVVFRASAHRPRRGFRLRLEGEY